MNKTTFLENGFVILRENESLHSPISVLHYECYKNAGEVFEKLSAQSEEVQCVACGGISPAPVPILSGGARGERGQLPLVPLGQTQNPKLWDYADGVDTMEFLVNLI
jgi:hypothetical protein